MIVRKFHTTEEAEAIALASVNDWLKTRDSGEQGLDAIIRSTRFARCASSGGNGSGPLPIVVIIEGDVASTLGTASETDNETVTKLIHELAEHVCKDFGLKSARVRFKGEIYSIGEEPEAT